MLPTSQQRHRVVTPICGLAEIMLVRLRATATGEAIAATLTMSPANAPARSIYGGDLDPPERPSCTLARLDTHCEPGFVTLLQALDLNSDLPARPSLLPGTEER